MLKILLVVLAITGVAVGSFFAARALLPEGAGKTEAQSPAPSDIERLLDEDAKKPRFSGVVNGIRLYDPDVGPERQSVCTAAGAKAEWVPIERARGSPLDIDPSYLPPGSEEVEAKVVECDGVLAAVERAYEGSGGLFVITRFQGEHAMSILAPSSRIKPITIGGKKAVVIEPVVSAHTYVIVVAEEFGVTTADSPGPLAVLIKVVEGLR